MKGSQLIVHATDQSGRLDQDVVVEWLLDEVDIAGIRGAKIDEVGHDSGAGGNYRAPRFRDAADRPVTITLVADDQKVDALLASLTRAEVQLFYTRCPVEFGVLGGAR